MFAERTIHNLEHFRNKRPVFEIIVWAQGVDLKMISAQHLSRLPSWLSSLVTNLISVSHEIVIVIVTCEWHFCFYEGLSGACQNSGDPTSFPT